MMLVLMLMMLVMLMLWRELMLLGVDVAHDVAGF